MSANGDLLAGIKTQWAATSSITSVIPTASLYLYSTKSGLAFPYCTVTVTKDGEPVLPAPQIPNVSLRLDYRRIRFEVYDDTAEDVDTALEAIIQGLNAPFTVANSAMIDWDLDSEPESPQEQEPRDGTPCYMGAVEFTTILQRTTP